MRGTATDSPRRHRLTVSDYYRMAETGILGPDERVELIAGEIIDVPRPGSRHAGTLKQLARILHTAVADAAIVQVQDPLSLGEYSEPQPDLALLRFEADFYRAAHPRAADTLLVIETADTSLVYDRDVKIPLYARHRVPEAWLVDVDRGVLTRYLEPRGKAYTHIDEPISQRPSRSPRSPIFTWISAACLRAPFRELDAGLREPLACGLVIGLIGVRLRLRDCWRTTRAPVELG